MSAGRPFPARALTGAALALAVLALGGAAHAYPRWFLEAGSPCGTCHVSPQGGGVRNDIGWYQETHASIAPLGKLMPSSQYISAGGAKLWAGGDFRFQLAKFGAPREGKTDVERSFKPMQMSLYAAAKPVDTVYITAALHAAYLADYKYPGQAPAEGAIQWSPKPSLPTIRAGLIQPSVGIRYEDHTMFIRQNAANPRSPYLPPTYVEPGIEASYHPISWFQAEFGLFNNHYLKESIGRDVTGELAYLARVMFLPQISALKMNAWLGGSVYGSGGFVMINGFLGLGFPKAVSLMVDAAQTSYGADKSTFVLSGTLGWSPKPWAYVYGRAEYSSAVVGSAFRGQNDAYVVGFTLNPIPFLEIRPEYRYLRTDAFILAQYALQVAAYF